MADKKKSKVVQKKVVNRTGKELPEKPVVEFKSKKQIEKDKKDLAKKKNEALVKAKEEKKILKPVQDDTKKEPKVGEVEYKLSIGVRDMFKAGCHLGHKSSKTNPKAQDYIYAKKDGVQIIDLMISIEQLKKAATFLHNAKRRGEEIVFLGTKRQAKEVMARVAQEVGVAYVTERWLGGTITNWEEIKKNLRRLTKLRENFEKGEYEQLTKKEQSVLRKEMTRLNRMVGGLVGLNKPQILVTVDAGMERTAVKEAKLKGIPVVALVDTDYDPKQVDYPIVVNDDNSKSINLIVEELGKALKM